MGIFDIFTNDAAKNAATQNAGLYQNYGTTANNALGTYGTTANDIFGNAYNTGTNYLTSYGDKALGAADNAVGAYTPLSDLATKYGGATNLALDSLGVNGAGGNTRAQDAFTTSPGYQFAVDEATKAAANKAASLGIAGSGNTLDEIRNRAQGIASQDYGNWRNSLLGFLPYEASTTAQAASGKAGAYGNEAGIYSGLGSSLTGLTSADAAARAGVAQNVAQGQTGVASNVASGLASSNNAEAQAEQNASNTFWNGLFSLGGAAAKAAFPVAGATSTLGRGGLY